MYFSGCCEPLYYNSFNEQLPWSNSEILHMKVIPQSSFGHGKCGNGLDLTKSDISVRSRGQYHLKSITISLHLKLNSVRGLHPVISAVNYNSQMRLEIQEGNLVWMFYNLGNSQGFIASAGATLKPLQWIYIVVDYNEESGLGRIFINNKLHKKTLSHVILSSDWMLGLRVGKYFSGGIDYTLDGYIDELHIFPCIMTRKEIERVSDICSDFKCNQSGSLNGKIL